MKLTTVALLALVCSCLADAGWCRWVEYFQVYAIANGIENADLIAAIDGALAPVGFHRDSTGTTYPIKSVPGIFASYSWSGQAAALVVEASRRVCVSIVITNYAEEAKGLADRAGVAIKDRLRQKYGNRVTFYSDSTCTAAL